MKKFSSYCILIACLGYFFAGSMGATIKSSFQAQNQLVDQALKKSENHTCCKKEAEKSSWEDHCKKESDKGSCKEDGHCSKACCNMGNALTSASFYTDIQYPDTKDFNRFLEGRLPVPFLGRIYPPPNA